MPAVNRLLSVAGEGGGIDLMQELGGAGRFRVVMVDQTQTFLDETEGGPPSRREKRSRGLASGPGRCFIRSMWLRTMRSEYWRRFLKFWPGNGCPSSGIRGKDG